MPLILSKSAFTGHETLMLIRRIPAYSVPIAEVLQRRTRGHFSTGSPARERNFLRHVGAKGRQCLMCGEFVTSMPAD